MTHTTEMPKVELGRRDLLGGVLGALAAPLAPAAARTRPDGLQAHQDATVICNALVIDGSGAKPFVGDVLLDGARIAAVGRFARSGGERVVDAGGLALAPGFIDTHSHHDIGLSDQRGAAAAVGQGITTIVVNQDGFGFKPLVQVLAELRARPAAVNVAAFCGHNYIRSVVMGADAARPATAQEIAQMKGLLRADLKAGALGLSTGLEYDPGRFSTRDEVLDLAREAARHGGRYASHIRNEDRELWSAVDEILTIGARTGMPVHLSHAKLALIDWWGQAAKLTNRLDQARARGVKVSIDVYPYPYWFGLLAVLWPDRDFASASAAEYILAHVVRPDGLRLADYPPEPALAGQTLAAIAQRRGTEPAATLIDLATRADGSGHPAKVICTSMAEDDVFTLTSWPQASVCSDGLLNGPHPRGAGSFPRVIRRMVRETGKMRLEQAVRHMTSQAALNMGLRGRGQIRRGYFADLVLFDPALIGDRATVENPTAAADGIAAVWVNGVKVSQMGAATGAYPGMAIARGDS